MGLPGGRGEVRVSGMAAWWQQALEQAGGTVDFGQWVAWALYDPGHGYYRQARLRVGRTTGTDFTTATAVGPEFGTLVVAAAETLVAEAGWEPEAMAWQEVGAEPERTVLDGVAHRFGQVTARRVGEAGAWPSPVVIFGNEVLDAQPFRRLRFRAGRWRELRVGLGQDGSPLLVEGPPGVVPPALAGDLPVEAAEGYTLDWSSGAEAWLRELVSAPWEGILILPDYGKMWTDLVENFPEGTARAYVGHRQDSDLLATPGDRDLTCHVAWDRLEAILQAGGFTQIGVERQEAFLMRRAGGAIAALAQRRPAETVATHLARVQAVKTVLHPAYYGTKFQVLSAVRRFAVARNGGSG